jgi:hypothetical protein
MEAHPNPPPVELPPPPTDPTIPQPAAPHSPPCVEDVLRAITYRHEVDASNRMLLIYPV